MTLHCLLLYLTLYGKYILAWGNWVYEFQLTGDYIYTYASYVYVGYSNTNNSIPAMKCKSIGNPYMSISMCACVHICMHI